MATSRTGWLAAHECWESLVWLTLAACLVWLLRHPYFGIYHDGTIYALLAAHWLEPDAYARDLFFLFGSQDRFSLFSPLFGALVSAFGPGGAARALVLAGGALWIAAATALARGAFHDALPIRVSVLLCTWITISYSPNGDTFLVTENFATARIIAQPLALLAVAAAVAGRQARAWAFAVSASLLHPLMGFWALLLIISARLPDRVLLVSILAAILLLASGTLLPVPTALQAMNPEWAGDVRAATRDVFIGPWGVFRLNDTLFWIAALLLGAGHGSASMRRWYGMTALLAVYAIWVSQLCSYFHPVQIVLQAQPWRVMWLAIIIGVFALIDVVWTIGQHKSAGYYWCALVALCLVLLPDFRGGLLLGVWLMASIDAFAPAIARMEAWRANHRLFAMGVLGLLAMIAAPGFLLDLEMAGQMASYPWWEGSFLLRGLLLAGGLGLTIIGLAALAGHAVWRRVLLVAVAAALTMVFVHWDHRHPHVREAESRYLKGTGVPFSGTVARGDVVAWPGGEMDTWFELGTANYLFWVQGVGGVFSHEKMREFRRRTERLEAAACMGRLGAKDAGAAAQGPTAIRVGACQQGFEDLDAEAIRLLCADPGLDWVVTRRDVSIAGGPSPTAVDTGRVGRRYLHDCTRFR